MQTEPDSLPTNATADAPSAGAQCGNTASAGDSPIDAAADVVRRMPWSMIAAGFATGLFATRLFRAAHQSHEHERVETAGRRTTDGAVRPDGASRGSPHAATQVDVARRVLVPIPVPVARAVRDSASARSGVAGFALRKISAAAMSMAQGAVVAAIAGKVTEPEEKVQPRQSTGPAPKPADARSTDANRHMGPAPSAHKKPPLRKTWWELIKQTVNEWMQDKAPRLGAALAYYTAFSLAPLLIIAIAVAGLFMGPGAVGQIDEQLQSLLGPQGAASVQELVKSANKPTSGTVATVLGVAALLFGASGVFGQLKDALNTIWEVEPKAGRGVWGIIKDRFLSFTMVLGIAFLLLVSLVVSAALATIGDWVAGLLPGQQILAQAIDFVFSFATITVLFALIFKILPDVKIAWRDVWLGAAVTAFLFTIGKMLIGLYLAKAAVADAYGAAGSIIIVLLWAYYSSQILFLGAEFTKVYARMYGSRIVPDEDAVPVTEESRAQQGIARLT